MSNTKVQPINREGYVPGEFQEALQTLEFGLKSVEHLPFDRLNVFTQTRKTYDEASLEDLARSIESPDKTGKPRNVLLHPPFVNILDRANAEAYIADLNICHKTDHSIDEAVPLDNGQYAIVVAGHRRRLAIGRLIQRQNADPATSTIASNVVYNQTFGEALRIQMDENTHLQLPVYEEARAIQAAYMYGVAKGDFSSVADCVRALPYGDEKVRNALRFCEMSDMIQDAVEDGYMSYGAAVALYPAMIRLRVKYRDYTDGEQIVQDTITRWALRTMRNGWGKDMVSAQVNELIRSLDKEAQFDMRLFEFDEEKVARQERQRAYRELFRDGMNKMRAFVGTAPKADLFKTLPVGEQEAIILEIKEFQRELGSLAMSDSIDQPSFYDL